MPKDTKTHHPCHQSELPKLNRVAGQIDGIKRMIEESRYCPDILTQLRAARAALKRVEADILETHLQSCVADAIVSGDKENVDQKVEEVKDLFRRFDDT